MAQEFIHQLHITGPEVDESFTLPAGSSTLGRQAGNTLVLNHFLVSRRHALMETTADSCQITDLDSSNGVTVNGEKLAPQVPVRLAPGAVIQIGPFILTYQSIAVEAEPEPVLPEPLFDEPPPVVEPEPEPAPPIEWPEPVSPEPVVAQTAEPEPPVSPPPAPPSVPPQPDRPSANGAYTPPPGLAINYSRYLEYLPGIYQPRDKDNPKDPNYFITRLLALLESILGPIEWNVDNFDLYLDPQTAPAGFLPWLANWFEIAFDDSWSEEQRRMLLKEAHQIYARRGTKWALSRVLEIYLGVQPEIDDQDKSLDPFTFVVKIPRRERGLNRTLIESIIDVNKPAHTSYTVQFL